MSISWRERLLLLCGPSLFGGITFGDWRALLRENRFDVDARGALRAAVITLGSLGNSLFRWREERAYAAEVATTAVPPPLFVLGVWRSGTTHLQNLLAVDPRFAFPTWYQASYPHTFLMTEATSAIGGFFVPRKRVQDNMSFGFALPAEEEFALCVATPFSPMLSWCFPRRAAHYDRYLTLRGVPAAEVAAWKAALLAFVRKLTFKHRKPLVLKSPAHTGRIRLLLDLFPEARFVHIRRNPYAVIESSMHTTRVLLPFVALQRPALDIEERAIRQYRELYEAYFDDKGLISPGRLHEVRFEDLETDPVGEMRKLYEALRLPDFGEVEQDVRRYVGTLSGYRKNRHAGLDGAVKQRIADECRRSFTEWGYPV